MLSVPYIQPGTGSILCAVFRLTCIANFVRNNPVTVRCPIRSL